MTPDPAPGAVLAGLRVLDRTCGIAGPYCAKVLGDAGADVVKVEPSGGDPLRDSGSGALFDYLNAGKRSVTNAADAAALADEADVVLSDEAVHPDELSPRHRAQVTVTVTPFGRSGPWVARPWTEFTLQAACGSTGQRGLPEEPPLAAGGRVGEWAAGTYAAVAALAGVHQARRTGTGLDIDVAILDCMAVSLITYPSLFASFTGWPALVGTGRTIQIPSIEPTSDGYFVVTANSAQQFQDLLVMIERPDLLDDPELAQVAKRFARRDEFLATVRAHTRTRTTAEVLEEAGVFRLPAAPVLDPPGVLAFEHFAARGVFEAAASGRFVQPRVPYRITGCAPRSPRPAPGLGEHDGATWTGRDRPPGHDAPGAGPGLPLAGVRVLDCTAWWAGPSATNALAALGADVIKIEAAARPDPMRLTSVRRPPANEWWEWGPVFHGVNLTKRGVTLDLGSGEGLALFRRMLGQVDLLVENFTPRVMEQFGLDWDSVHALNPRLVMVRMPAFGLDGPWRDRTGFAQTMEAVSGLTWRTGFPDGLPTLVLGACDPVAGMHAAAAALLGLARRDETGAGLLVESVMVEAALNIAAEALVEYSATGTVLGREGNRGPDAAPQGVYRCAGADAWVALAVERDEHWAGLIRALGRPDWAVNKRLSTKAGRVARHDEIDTHLQAWTSRQDAQVVVDTLAAAGVPAEVVIAARDVVHNPQLGFRGLFETEDHPVTGRHAVPTLPFHLAGLDGWLRAPSPTLGEHNDEVLAELGLTTAQREALRSAGVIGERLAGA
jgi:crotonobetainyl-CoA:carnitine CoA-transferase CaiB-like acyl-CoA transferase